MSAPEKAVGSDVQEPTLYDRNASRYHIPGYVEIGRKAYGDHVDDNVKKYEQQYDGDEEQTESRIQNAKSIATSFYTLVTDFYEYGYGHSFHFAPVMDSMSFSECIAHYERSVGKTLGAKPGMTMLDVGCGIGGPQREIASSTGAHIVGLNCCDYQLKRAREHTEKAKLQELCSFIKGDFTCTEFNDDTFDGAYAFEATCHANDPINVYREVFRVLKPGAFFVDCAWALTDNYDENNPDHVKIKNGILVGNGLPELRSEKKLLQEMRNAGFTVVEFRDATRDGDYPWYSFLSGKTCCTLANFRMSSLGRLTTHSTISVLETLGMSPKGSTKVHSVLLTAADSLISAGKLDIFTPEFRIVAQKPPV